MRRPGRRHDLVRGQSAVPLAAHHRPLHEYLGRHRGRPRAERRWHDGRGDAEGRAVARAADSKGTIGSLDATLSWKSAGIKDTVAANLPGVGSLVTGVRTDPAAGTVIFEAGDNSVTAKPVVTEGDLTWRCST